MSVDEFIKALGSADGDKALSLIEALQMGRLGFSSNSLPIAKEGEVVVPVEPSNRIICAIMTRAEVSISAATSIYEDIISANNQDKAMIAASDKG